MSGELVIPSGEAGVRQDAVADARMERDAQGLPIGAQAGASASEGADELGGVLRCGGCGHTVPLGDVAKREAEGWPKCCGETMSWMVFPTESAYIGGEQTKWRRRSKKRHHRRYRNYEPTHGRGYREIGLN